MNLNKVLLVGRITRDPEVRSTTTGQNVAQIGLATNRVWNKDGQKQESTEFHNIVAWGRLAEIAGQYMKKGALIMVEGRLQTRSWQGQDGATKYRTEIVAENIQLGPRSATQSGGSNFGQNSSSNVNSQNEIPETPTINLDEEGNPMDESGSIGEPPETVMPF